MVAFSFELETSWQGRPSRPREVNKAD
jgi:hypothetical protein